MLDNNANQLIYVVAGSYSEFLDWTNKNVNNIWIIYVSSMKKLRGLSNARVLFVGTYESRPDYLDIHAYCQVHGFMVSREDVENDIVNEVKERGNEQGKTRFDLEEGIMNAWAIVSDLRSLVNNWDNVDDEKKYKIIEGLAELLDFKMEVVFDTFETLVHDKVIK